MDIVRLAGENTPFGLLHGDGGNTGGPEVVHDDGEEANARPCSGVRTNQPRPFPRLPAMVHLPLFLQLESRSVRCDMGPFVFAGKQSNISGIIVDNIADRAEHTEVRGILYVGS